VFSSYISFSVFIFRRIHQQPKSKLFLFLWVKLFSLFILRSSIDIFIFFLFSSHSEVKNFSLLMFTCFHTQRHCSMYLFSIRQSGPSGILFLFQLLLLRSFTYIDPVVYCNTYLENIVYIMPNVDIDTL